MYIFGYILLGLIGACVIGTIAITIMDIRDIIRDNKSS